MPVGLPGLPGIPCGLQKFLAPAGNIVVTDHGKQLAQPRLTLGLPEGQSYIERVTQVVRIMRVGEQCAMQLRRSASKF